MHKKRSLNDFIATSEVYDQLYIANAEDKAPRALMMSVVRASRNSDKYLEPTRENILLCLAGVQEELRDQIADLAIKCFEKVPTITVAGEGDEEYFEVAGEDVYIQLDEYALMRICNYKTDALSISISDRGTLTHFKFKAPVLRLPYAIADHAFFNPSDVPDYAVKSFETTRQKAYRKKYGNVGDRFNPLGLAWKYGEGKD